MTVTGATPTRSTIAAACVSCGGTATTGQVAEASHQSGTRGRFDQREQHRHAQDVFGHAEVGSSTGRTRQSLSYRYVLFLTGALTLGWDTVTAVEFGAIGDLA